MTRQHLMKQREGVVAVNFDREAKNCGIVHIGVGNFHRAHQQYYTNLLLADTDQQQWGICGVALLATDEKLVRALQAQQGLYSLTVCGRDGNDEVHQISSLLEVIWGVEAPNAVIDKIAAADTKIITLTITEGGYHMDSVSGEFQLDHAAITQDLANAEAPKTVFGFVAAGLKKRMAAGYGGLTILSCDNLQHNGDTAKRAFTAFFEALDAELAAWTAENVTFPNSMVDRITPGTRAEDIAWLNQKNQLDDQAPVYCEDFIQWVIEDNFAAGRPAWERVGVEFTHDVTAFEHMKLSLLNASHSLLSYPAFLTGHRKVDEAMSDPNILAFVRDFMDKDITPYVPAPANTNLEEYKQILLERFANRTVSDQVSRLCFDGMSKFPIYLMPNVAKMLADGQDMTRIAFGLAAYRHYLKYQQDDQGAQYQVAEPWLTEADLPYIQAEDPLEFLQFKPFKGSTLSGSESFKERFTQYCQALEKQGAAVVLASIVS